MCPLVLIEYLFERFEALIEVILEDVIALELIFDGTRDVQIIILVQFFHKLNQCFHVFLTLNRLLGVGGLVFC